MNACLRLSLILMVALCPLILSISIVYIQVNAWRSWCTTDAAKQGGGEKPTKAKKKSNKANADKKSKKKDEEEDDEDEDYDAELESSESSEGAEGSDSIAGKKGRN